MARVLDDLPQTTASFRDGRASFTTLANTRSWQVMERIGDDGTDDEGDPGGSG